MNRKQRVIGFLAIALVFGLGFASTASAESGSSFVQKALNKIGHGPRAEGEMRGEGRAVVGTVSAINGVILTVEGKQNPRATTTATTTYSVDTTNARIVKGNATTTIASIVVGDMVVVQGVITDTAIAAKTVRVGAIGQKGGWGDRAKDWRHSTSTEDRRNGWSDNIRSGFLEQFRQRFSHLFGF